VWDTLIEGIYRTETSASSNLSGVYIGPLIRHCLRGKYRSRIQALSVPYNYSYSLPPPGPPRLTYNIWSLLYFRGWLLHSGGDYYAPGVTTTLRGWLLRSGGDYYAPGVTTTLRGWLLRSGGDYCAPDCRLLSSSIQPSPQQVQQPLP
jgi:hypothetical protein